MSRYTVNELFRFARVRPPAILDIEYRWRRQRRQLGLGADQDQRREWATRFLECDGVESFDDLSGDYLKHLTVTKFPDDQIPGRQDLKDVAAFLADRPRRAPSYTEDLARVEQTLLAHSALGNETALAEVSRWLQFLESYPTLAARTRRSRYAQAVQRKFRVSMPAPASPPIESPGGADSGAVRKGDKPGEEIDEHSDEISKAEIRRLQDDLDRLWRARTHASARRQKKLVETLRQGNAAAEAPAEASPMRAMPQPGEAESSEIAPALRDRQTEISAARAARRELQVKPDLRGSLDDRSDDLSDSFANYSDEKLDDVRDRIKALLDKLGVSPSGFCEAFEVIAEKTDNQPGRDDPAEVAMPGCFQEHPSISFQTHVRPVGVGTLFTVEETLLKYTEGEISYVANVLARERRSRELKSTQYREQLTETETVESSDVTAESSSKISSELVNEVESEISTRFNSDVNASVSGSGGGSIGVVDFEGGGSLDAGVGVGVDTSMRNATESGFAQEIVDKAIEKTKSSTRERRLQRSYSLHETTNVHEIDNTPSDTHKRGIYCFLDKHVTITEREYGRRLFLLANVLTPGKNLVCESRYRHALHMQDNLAKPVFDITPADIQPHTYKKHAARFKSPNVAPPPDAIQHIARTYKTDTVSKNEDGGGGFDLGKVVDVLIPFFENYQRFVITDTVQIPPGYMVQEAKVIVNHGANGISIPAHLPLNLLGASIYSAPVLGYAALMPYIYLPLAVWQIAYLASPMLHQNADSSNVTVSIGTESQDSPYYFFPPDMLLAELQELVANLALISPDLVNQINTRANQLVTGLSANAGDVPGEIQTVVQTAVSDVLAKVHNAIQALYATVFPVDGQTPPDLATALTALTQSITVGLGELQDSMDELYEPLQSFITDVFNLIRGAVETAIPDFMAGLLANADNSQHLDFGEAHGLQSELPVSLNAIAIKPGITVNLVVCLRRTERALEKWSLDTFNALYQAYLQQVAEYESRNFEGLGTPRLAKSPGTMRDEEHRALKEQILHALNNYHSTAQGQSYELDRINLFEHGIDWQNLSYKVFNYGPNPGDVQLEQLGIFDGVDARRRAFLTAHWAQVLVPVQGSVHAEQRVLKFLEEGETDLDAELEDEELIALYQDLILDRDTGGDVEAETQRVKVLPTDLVVIRPDGSLPSNESGD